MNVDIVFIDKEMPFALASKVLQIVHDTFSIYYIVKCYSVADGKEAFSVLNEEKKNNYVGSFTVVAFEKNADKFKKEFPNNVVAAKEDIDDNEVMRISKQVVWILNGFGKEKKNMANNTFIIGDLHFQHKNIIKYCNRPWNSGIDNNGNLIVTDDDVSKMNSDLIINWNSVVSENDTVIVNGDFCLGNRSNIPNFVKQLNGNKWLIIGNHDYFHIKNKEKYNNIIDFYYKAGFSRVYDHPIIINDFIIISHEPIAFITEQCAYANIFAHVHNNNMYKDFTKNTFCSSVERINYTPISLAEIQKHWIGE